MTSNSKTGWLGDSTEKQGSLCIILVFLSYYLSLVSFNTINDGDMFHVYVICMKGQHAMQDLKKSLPALVLCSPVIAFALFTLIMDAKCLWFIKKHKKSMTGKRRHGIDTIPLRATIISIICLIPATISCPILGILYYVSDDLQFKFYVTFATCNVVAILRNPIIALFTFRANEKNKKKNHKADMGRKRLKKYEASEGALMRKQKSTSNLADKKVSVMKHDIPINYNHGYF